MEVRARLVELKHRHRDLDDAILEIQQAAYPDPLRMRRLKKQKLQLRDAIARLESLLIPDLDA
ncbi:MAG: DUF465 domain-containing protein [Pseudomonadota bacterium]